MTGPLDELRALSALFAPRPEAPAVFILSPDTLAHARARLGDVAAPSGEARLAGVAVHVDPEVPPGRTYVVERRDERWYWYTLRRAQELRAGTGPLRALEVAVKMRETGAPYPTDDPTGPPPGASSTSVAFFEWQARFMPVILLARIEDTPLEPADLAHAAAALEGAEVASDFAARILLPLLRHERGFVREGAAWGLRGHLDHPGVRDAIQAARAAEPYESVRAAFDEVLDEEVP